MSIANLENHYKDLFEKTSDLIHFANPEGRIILVNNSWLSTLEYRLDEVAGRSIFEFIDPEWVDAYHDVRDRSISGVDPGIIQTVLVSKSGKKIILEGLVGISLEEGKLKYTRGVFRNVTERIIVEKRLENFFRSAPDAVIVINEKHEILEWNPKAEITFGFLAAEVKGRKLHETIIPPQFREAHLKGMERFLNTGETRVLNRTIEITALKKTGDEFSIDLSISGVYVESGWLFIAFVSDITEKKKTEEELIRKEADLMQARLMEERKDEFISIASHELKTPLTTIKAYTQIGLKEAKKAGNATVANYLEKINEYTAKLSKLINELLDVSKIQAGKLKLSTATVKSDEYLNEVLLSIQHITPTHKIKFQDIQKADIDVDPLRFEQVMTNIISNAAKYSPGKDEILVTSHLLDGQIIISITDHGIGIPQENIENIFTRFYRVEESSKQFSGMGIGLFVASEIIKQHNGKIWAESEKGKFTSFHISLPVVGADGPPERIHSDDLS